MFTCSDELLKIVYVYMESEFDEDVQVFLLGLVYIKISKDLMRSGCFV
jgi:hypothetical protein